ncbi:hypothetical protein CPU09_02640 [Mammaliicoccus sciuri]|uniref:hypothetical protein n=1 Tax=Mammaliicoccus sciuri TaxID=1296 RepID=UPI000BBE8C53|nr:hypothetical protein [Mammaliicoccus sciuri]PCM42041.1 hypothetical protein CPU09_02640 [Mammaliicoccus sciuri]
MTLSIIGLIMSIVCLIISIIVFRYNRKISKSSSNGYLINSIDKELHDLSNKVQPLIDKHNEEQEQEEIKTRKAHWKSFNKWKMQKERMNRDAGDTPICGACYNNSLELDVEYKTVEGEPYYTSWGDVVHLESKKDYPLSAEQKCTVCGHVADKWKCKEC